MCVKELLDPLPGFPCSPSDPVVEHRRVVETFPEFDPWDAQCSKVKYFLNMKVLDSFGKQLLIEFCFYRSSA